MKPLPFPVLAGRLSSARDFIEVALRVCAVATELGVEQCVVTLYAASGRPVLRVDNTRESRDDRVAEFAHHWVGDPMLRALRTHHAPIEDRCVLAVPLLEPGLMIGTIVFRGPAPFAPEVARDLRALGTCVSVRLAQLGIRAQPDSQPFSHLTPRQLWVALLAARGDTNAEIAALLGLSENTVKKHLKDVYDRIGLANRTELASLLARASLPHDVCEQSGVTVTRA